MRPSTELRPDTAAGVGSEMGSGGAAVMPGIDLGSGGALTKTEALASFLVQG
jgi:hypothetical protein